jgi:hypothetical protein
VVPNRAFEKTAGTNGTMVGNWMPVDLSNVWSWLLVGSTQRELTMIDDEISISWAYVVLYVSFI